MANESLAVLWKGLSDGQREEVLDTWDEHELAQLAKELAAESAELQAREDPLAHLDTAEWLRFMFPDIFSGPFADFHLELCHWADGIRIDEDPPEFAFVGIWPRGFSKSSLIEAIVAMLGCRRRRRYVLYVGDIQSRAEDHLSNITALLERTNVEHYYPDVGQRLLGKWGSVKGWRRMRIRCANGFTVDAVGLDSTARGVKTESYRPDCFVGDDLDQHDDTPAMTRKKIDMLTLTLLPAGAMHMAAFFVQNMVHAKSIFARLSTRTAGFLEGAHLSGPVPAVYDAEYGVDDDGVPCLVGGQPSWPEVMGMEHLNDLIQKRFGLRGFRAECQHEEVAHEGALWSHEIIDGHRSPSFSGVRSPIVIEDASPSADASRAPSTDPDVTTDSGRPQSSPVGPTEGALSNTSSATRHSHQARKGTPLPQLTHVVVALDPASTKKASSDETGIVVVGKGDDGRAYVLEDLSGKYTPRAWARVALDAYSRWAADWIVGETNMGGDMIEAVIQAELMLNGGERPAFREVTATRGKVLRAEPIVALYQSHLVWHAGVFPLLESQMTTWRPPNGEDKGSTWSPDRMDALVWGVWLLMVEQGADVSYSSVLSFSDSDSLGYLDRERLRYASAGGWN